MGGNREALVRLVGRDVRDERVLDAFRSVAREEFVPGGSRDAAYRDRPVGLPRNQTTSQPTLIARMIAAARVGPEDAVLEIGTGFGFQTALLARLARRVVSVERYEELAEAARENLRRVGIDNAEVVVGDGWQGWSGGSPYDAIVVSAAASEVPAALGDQLVEGGRLVIPVTRRGSDDVLLFEKRNGRLEEIALITPARFVPLVRGIASDD